MAMDKEYWFERGVTDAMKGKYDPPSESILGSFINSLKVKQQILLAREWYKQGHITGKRNTRN